MTFNIPDAARSVQNADNSIQSEVNAAAQTIASAAEKLSALVESAAQLLPRIVGQRPQVEEIHPDDQHKQDSNPGGTKVEHKKSKSDKDKKKKKKQSKHYSNDKQEGILSAATGKMLADDPGNPPSDQHHDVDSFIESMHQEG